MVWLSWVYLGISGREGWALQNTLGSSGVDCIGSLLAFLLRFREKCLYDILNTCHNSPLRQINVLAWSKFTVPAPVYLPLRY